MLLNDRLNKDAIGGEFGGKTQEISQSNKNQSQIMH